jgi:transmembrane sensor
MRVDRELIKCLVIDEIMGVITPENDIILKNLLETEPLAVNIREELYTKLTTPEAKIALKRLDEGLTIERFWEEVEIRKKEKVAKRDHLAQALRVAAITIAGAAAGGLLCIYLPRLMTSTTKQQLIPSTVLSSAGKTSVLRSNGQEVAVDNKPQLTIGGATFKNEHHRLKLLSNNSKQFITVDAAPKEIYAIELPDGTEVILNSVSTIQFLASFGNDSRNIAINGIAYIKAAKNAAKPLQVYLPNKAKIEVLGTEFNINTDDSTDMKVMLVEGKVRVIEGNQAAVLTPGQMLHCKPGQKMQQPLAFTEDMLLWKEGKDILNHPTIQEIQQLILRRYGYNAIIDSNTQKDTIDANLIIKNIPLNELLNVLKETAAFKYYYERNNILHIQKILSY